MSSEKPVTAPADTAAAADTEKQTPSSTPAARRRLRGRLLGIAALAVLAGGGYLYWKLQQSARVPGVGRFEASAPEPRPQQPASAPLAALAPSTTEPPAGPPLTERAVEDARVLDAPPPAESAPDERNRVDAQLASRLTDLETAVAALAAAPPPAPVIPDSTALTLTEATDLVALAEQRLGLARDLNGAMAALRLAIARLASGDFPAQRRALQADLAALDAFHDVDVASLSAELAALARGAVSLPLAGPAPLAPAAPPPAVGGWREVLGAIGASLRGLVEVREADETRDPLLNPAHAALARQQLALDLSAARVAMLQRDAAALHAALTPAIAELDERFLAEDPDVASVLARLRELAMLDIAPVLPSLARSVDALAAAAPLPSPAPATVDPPPRATLPMPETAL